MRKSKSVPAKLNHYAPSIMRKNVNSYHDFGSLDLKGKQRAMTFGEYSSKKHASRANKKKVIAYFYRKLRAKM